ncbi:cdc42 effector protein 5 [Conger conger]|uniref:cdc42 effector protein 5 n=1 Tax=Conger conger TaxID=82655 RepID=UPI002A59AC68|nr:cdc42 effector protein 5 [Conger conger]XP_061092891.1 cdc42 effector protein 5 [Conger conger]XP_061092899.1 cdc42 effector protein 5 [Conger conger]
MPLHKSSRGHRLDPTMISAPLGDFRHTMHIGRGGDAFGDTSFLSTHGQSPPDSNSVPAVPGTNSEAQLSDGTTNDTSPQSCELQHSESVSSLSLDLDLDLGPSILGDVLGVMDGLALDSAWTTTGGEEVFSPSQSEGEIELSGNAEESLLSAKNELNVKWEISQDGQEFREKGDRQLSDGSSLKCKGVGLRPKVRFSDKREEIIGREEEGYGLEQDVYEAEHVCPVQEEGEAGIGTDSKPTIRGSDGEEPTNHLAESPPSPASSLSSEYEGVTPLDRRREEDCHSETDSEEEGTGNERGYTFEDEFDDEIGL